jgi:sugar O-acyltransferase (sialic acid O-acetyltransferase NeuD family)
MKERVAIIGAGELGKQIQIFLQESYNYQLVGFYDDTLPKGSKINNIEVSGNREDILSDYQSGKFDSLMVAIAYKHMHVRKQLYEKFSGIIPFTTLIHPSCIISSSAIIGEGSVIYPGCIIDKNVVIGKNVLLNLGVIVSHDSVIGDHSFLAPGVRVSGFVKMEECCFSGTGSIFIDTINICPDVTIGAGSVIINDLTEKGVYAGNPSKKIR